MPNRNIRAISNEDMHLRILLGFLTSILLRLGSLSQKNQTEKSGFFVSSAKTASGLRSEAVFLFRGQPLDLMGEAAV